MFEKKYGKIVRYEHYGDGYIVIAFANGFLSHVSTHSREMSKSRLMTRLGKELNGQKIFQSIDDMCIN